MDSWCKLASYVEDVGVLGDIRFPRLLVVVEVGLSPFLDVV